MALQVEQPRARAAFRNRALMTLMLGHFTVDSYVGVLPVLYPLLVGRFALDLKTVGLVALAYSGMASLAQPLFGWIADRVGTRFIGLALVWTATLFATIGFAPSFPTLLLLAGAAGLGSGAYHPFGALSARRVIDASQRNTAMSLYITGGTLGVALGPLIGIVLFGLAGLRGTALLWLPGSIVALWMLWELRAFAAQPPAPQAATALRPARGSLAVVVGVMMTVACTLSSVQAFLPIWYASLGYSPAFYGPLATTLLLSNAIGALGAGALADRAGRRVLVRASLALGIPSLLLLTAFTGPIAFVSVALVGLSVAAASPLLLLTAQGLVAGRAGLATGLILGLGFVTGAIGVPLTGALADAVGIPAALRALVLVVALGLALTWFLPDERLAD
jgi:FSR family fosmidomycin resistance protein-like MFS transporter